MTGSPHLVLVHRNRGTTCAATVRRFLNQARAAAFELTVTVVDNGSNPDELAALRQGLPAEGRDADRVEVLETGSNLGFGPGANVGLQRWLDGTDGDPGGEVCLVAPHDARPAEGTVASLVREFLARPDAGLASADVGDGEVPRIQPWLGPIGEPALPLDVPLDDGGAGQGADQGANGSAVRWEACDYPHGTLMAARRACLEAVGTFDERYFAYCEEADLGLRARAAGWEVGLVRGALVHNPESNTEAAVIDHLMVRNTLLLLRTHFGVANMAFRIGVVAAEHVVGWWKPEVRGPYHTGRARLRAVADALTGRFGNPSRTG